MQEMIAQPVSRATHANKQKQRNRRMPKAGKVTFAGQDCTIHCMVREFSEHRAILTMNGWMGFPQEFMLSVDSEDIRIRCKIEKRRGSTVEVTFPDADQVL